MQNRDRRGGFGWGERRGGGYKAGIIFVRNASRVVLVHPELIIHGSYFQL